jgi:hypothetical protein
LVEPLPALRGEERRIIVRGGVERARLLQGNGLSIGILRAIGAVDARRKEPHHIMFPVGLGDGAITAGMQRFADTPLHAGNWLSPSGSWPRNA